MKYSILLPLLSVTVVMLGVLTLAGCKAGTKKTTKLPDSCSLLAMSPEDRAIHQNRLATLQKASRFERETSEGFEFSVDLHQMPADELNLWMKNEQSCCSFLEMSRHIEEMQQRARVTVKCSPDVRPQVEDAFGLKAANPRP